MRNPSASFFALVLVPALAAPTLAAVQTFNINADGIKEVNSGGASNGDADGTAVGTLMLDNGTGAGATGSATINLTLANLDLSNFTGHHIHNAASTTTGPIVVDFGDPDTLRTGNTLNGTITGLPAATISGIFSNPSNFYYNLHNGTFPSGAVRDQLPEPAALSLLGFAAVLLRRTRR
jgi:hypothetical protein